ncbi:MAG: biotin/lipoyl-binding protein [Chloroflexales bacterium]|nr:biotin/lipoyl-binding protein [Chloroflexales bacterium]
MRKIFTSTVLSFALAAGLVACGPGAQPAAQTAPTALPAVAADSAVIAEAKVVPVNSVDLSFETGGKVAELLVDEGEAVTAGQPLARLDTRDLTLSVEQAQVSLQQAQADYDKLIEGATPERSPPPRPRSPAPGAASRPPRAASPRPTSPRPAPSSRAPGPPWPSSRLAPRTPTASRPRQASTRLAPASSRSATRWPRPSSTPR